MTTHLELAAEQAAIDRAYARLDAMRAAARAVSEDVLRHGHGGTHSARFERDVRVEATKRRLAVLRDAGDSLVFGRIDRADGERLYIGVVAIADEHNEPLVVDWRAPAAEPFYRATPGNAMGLVRRRHFLMSGRELVGIEDDLLDAGTQSEEDSDLVLVGEAALLASLVRTRTGRMGDIVATIQGEQDEAIRAPLPGILVVQGGPGTGKTAVALHRAAYLLYTHRFPLEWTGVLLVGPNRVFLRYIEQVLPSLGEQTVTFATPGSLLPAVTVSGHDIPEAVRVKGDARMAEVLMRAVRQRQRPLARPTTVRLGAHVLTLGPAETEPIVRRVARRRGTHNERRRAFERQLINLLIEEWWRREGRPRDDNLAEDLEYRLHGQRAFVDAVERMWPVLTPAALLNDLFGIPAFLRLAAKGVLRPEEWAVLERPRHRRLADITFTEDDVALLDEAWVHLGPVPARRANGNGDGDAPSTHDDELIERTIADLGPVDAFMRADLRDHLEQWTRPESNGDDRADLATQTFGHVLVDEAQDLSAMQARMIGRHVPGASMTLVGDLGQGSSDHAAPRWDDLLSHLPHRQGSRVVELSVNYRTPVEVMDLAARVLAVAAPALVPPRSVRSTGELPTVTRVVDSSLAETATAAARAELATVASGRVAVIAPEALVAELRAALGAPDAGARALEQPLAVYSVGSAKGLEFDAVVVVEPAAIVAERRNGMRALYVALTRTTRRLHLVHGAPLPAPLVGSTRNWRTGVT
ncbi:MAG: AAA family ATPase [Actinomycetota bacterium]|nr:AAA family ATPase [Actinomycetota bacterium]